MVKTGFTNSGDNRAVELSVNDQMYVNVPGTNLSAGGVLPDEIVISSSTGGNASLYGATDQSAGLMTTNPQTFAGDKTFDDDFTAKKAFQFEGQIRNANGTRMFSVSGSTLYINDNET